MTPKFSISFLVLIALLLIAAVPIKNLVLQGDANGGYNSFTNLNSVVANTVTATNSITLPSSLTANSFFVTNLTLRGTANGNNQVFTNLSTIISTNHQGNGANLTNLTLLAQPNVAINGNFSIWQDGTSFASIASGTYTADQFVYFKAGTAAAQTVFQTNQTPNVSAVYALDAITTTADATQSAGDVISHQQKIEGYRFLAIANSSFTASFYVRASKVGTMCVAFQNTGNDRSWVSEVVIAASNTWQLASLTVTTPPTAGTWNYTTGIGLRVNFTMMGGSTYQAAQAGDWETGNFYATANQTNFCAANNDEIQISQLRIVPGSTIGAFVANSPQQDLIECGRYYQVLTADANSSIFAFGQAYNNFTMFGTVDLPVQMRTIPTLAISTASDFAVYTSGAALLYCTNIFLNCTASHVMSLNATTTNGLTAGNATALQGNTTAAKLKFNARL